MAVGISLNIKSELPNAERWTKAHSKQLAYSVSQALNAAAGGSKFIANSKNHNAISAFQDVAKQRLDRPKPQTVQGLRISKLAKKRSLSALIEPKTPKAGGYYPGRYISGNVYGGVRPQKSWERELISKSLDPFPTGARLVPTGKLKPDRYGNISRGKLRAIERGLGHKYKRGGSYFIGQPKGAGRDLGVYQRMGGNKRLRPVFLLEQTPDYRAILPAIPAMRREVSRNFGRYLRTQLAVNVRNQMRGK